MNTCSVTTEHYEVTFKNSINNSLRYRRLVDTWVNDKEDATGLCVQFAYIVSHIEHWKGDVWTPPKSDTPAALDKAFASFGDVFSLEQYNQMNQAVDSLHRSGKSVLEKPDHELTEDEQADPN